MIKSALHYSFSHFPKKMAYTCGKRCPRNESVFKLRNVCAGNAWLHFGWSKCSKQEQPYPFLNGFNVKCALTLNLNPADVTIKTKRELMSTEKNWQITHGVDKNLQKMEGMIQKVLIFSGSQWCISLAVEVWVFSWGRKFWSLNKSR